MCIVGSVGRDASNGRVDVVTVQLLLNLNAEWAALPAPLATDGRAGRRTIAAIESFQRQAVKMRLPDGRVEPNRSTLAHLRGGLPPGFSAAKLHGVMIRATPVGLATYAAPLATRMAVHGIDTPLRMAHFLAQIAHESGDLRYAEELGSGARYEGRADLGNRRYGDGRRFKGRGLIQLTGRANYARYGKARGRDFTTAAGARALATDPELAVDVACWFWHDRGLNAFADADDLAAVTRVINGGAVGLAQRRAKLDRARFFFVAVPLTARTPCSTKQSAFA